MLASNRGFLVIKVSSDDSQILKRPIQVAMATKFETKSAITQLAYEIYRRSLCKTGGFRVRAIK